MIDIMCYVIVCIISYATCRREDAKMIVES